MHKLLTDSPGKEMFLLGNEAIARGAIEAGISVATCYPGTPSSEIPDTFFAMYGEGGFYFGRYFCGDVLSRDSILGDTGHFFCHVWGGWILF